MSNKHWSLTYQHNWNFRGKLVGLGSSCCWIAPQIFWRHCCRTPKLGLLSWCAESQSLTLGWWKKVSIYCKVQNKITGQLLFNSWATWGAWGVRGEISLVWNWGWEAWVYKVLTWSVKFPFLWLVNNAVIFREFTRSSRLLVSALPLLPPASFWLTDSVEMVLEAPGFQPLLPSTVLLYAK